MATVELSSGRNHESYYFDDADIFLLSKDGVKFGVHATVLQRASRVFQAMLSIPRDCDEDFMSVPILMEEDELIISALLDIIYSKAGRPKQHIRAALTGAPEDLALAADKYDMPEAVSEIREALFYDFKFSQIVHGVSLSPIARYGLACRLGWKVEAQQASTDTLTVDLTSPEVIEELGRIGSIDVLRLQELHRTRRFLFLEALSVDDVAPALVHDSFGLKAMDRPHLRWRFVCRNDGDAYFNLTIWRSLDRDPAWKIFKYRVARELDICSRGDKLRQATSLWNDPELSDIFKIKYDVSAQEYLIQTRGSVLKGHSEFLFNRDTMVSEVNRILDLLPKTIDTAA